ncbi:glycosyltransferase family 2 protein [Kluyvera cryocrescens]|uniref:glycosyltransferase family 2 protein n=1 Tax=Kluyvera cryocrescens TaxID=580 RepID=UPI002DBB6576|nr:glycosyltransferase family 2 protein [Kluyvera cryocrescens]MEB7713072.1 glycosyltransferase family 2 protein [Kluyvera cryocrescens]
MEANTSAIIIAYNPDVNTIIRNVGNIIKSPFVKEVIIVDNSAFDSLDVIADFERVKTISLGCNKGIATAQNIGLTHAKESGSSFAILFDQDSEIETSLIGYLLEGFHELTLSGFKIAAVGPRPYDLFENKDMKPMIQRETHIEGKWSLTRQIIASGKLIDISVLDNVGMMEDELFIDGVDHEWCWRAGKMGYQIAIIEKAVMKHRLGDARGHVLGMTYKIGSPVRLYYQFRNILILCRRSYVPLYWKIRCLVSMVFRFIIFSFKGVDADKRRNYMIKGFLDGVKNKKGSID